MWWQQLTSTKIDTIAKMVVCRQLFGRALCVSIWFSRVHLVHVRSDFLFKIIEKWKSTITFIAHCEQCDNTDMLLPCYRQWQRASEDSLTVEYTVTVAKSNVSLCIHLLPFVRRQPLLFDNSHDSAHTHTRTCAASFTNISEMYTALRCESFVRYVIL